MFSVIIPVFNEEQTIGRVVRQVKGHPLVEEVIVVDDKSLDRTVPEAKAAGAHVITGTKIGKGASMRDGLLVAKGKILLFLDGDIEEYVPDLVQRMTAPIRSGKADFTKSTFQREAGRVTELVAKPLLTLLFPELTVFSQPLSGIIAGRRSFFDQITFEDDYGVDIGILIDMHLLKAHIQEIDIGCITHKMKTWRELGSMSRQVARAILKRASQLSLTNLQQLGSINIIRDQMTFALKEYFTGLRKMAVFDMDNTLLQGRFIEAAAQEFGFRDELRNIVSHQLEPYLAAKENAQLLKGRNIAEILAVVSRIPLTPFAHEVVAKLKERGYLVGIITDSYDCVVTHVKNELGADFSLAYELEFSESIATGEVKIPSFFLKNDGGFCSHTLCKSNALQHAARESGIELRNTIVVGDSENDVCMVRLAGVGVAFCSSSAMLNLVADKHIQRQTLRPVLEIAH
jgi:phosphoserine phosphatase SerB